MNDFLLVTCKSMQFKSPLDKDLFFSWIKKNSAITNFKIENEKLYLSFSNIDISEEELLEILALLYRYNVDMKPLAIFLTPDNKEWFRNDKHAYWHRPIFGGGKIKPEH